ncbi:acetylxylan esterase [Cellulomonas bogoriensis]|uniref:Acetyl xylan esterase n=1 Tax=Cellulomonas bogoriensis 69B4 = DSM 16987 TaxID=1386082 RepID=A0A0A0BMC9_9CELL|nr:acetylxylan esterase [Cellulomonas bogoriensis]KGM09658.1 acetyl xylan esterase [Cellulomonas bogoriensis 69B4 = DSM 16987]
MPLFDMPVEELRGYLPDVAEPQDFDEFWARTLRDARRHEVLVDVAPVSTSLRLVDVHDVTFAGFDGQPVRAWLTRPAGVPEPLPVVVEYLGYGGGRGLPHERLAWAAAGYAHLVMDTRGQGSVWSGGGATPDLGVSGPAVPGFMTRGIEDPHDHYYRRLVTDAVRAVDAARALPGVDPTRVTITGISQGGGVTLAVAGLTEGLTAVMPDVPFMCHVRRGMTLTDQAPYRELVTYLAVHRGAEDMVLRTWSYLDAVNFARRATAPALFSVALMDTICPPSTVYAAYNHYGSHAGSRPTTDIVVYRYNQHEGGQAHQTERQLTWLGDLHGVAQP